MAVILSSVNSSYCMCLQGLCFVEDRGIGISPGKDAICQMRLNYCII